MNTDEKRLIKVKENFLNKIINKIKRFFFRKKSNAVLKEEMLELKNPLEEQLEKLKIEFNELSNIVNTKKMELEYIQLKDYKIALEIYKTEESELLEIIKLKSNKLKRILNEYNQILEQRRNI